MTFDPIGPGTPAWNAAERACEYWQSYRATRSRRAYKNYYNALRDLKHHMTREGYDHEYPEWTKYLLERREEPCDDQA